MRSGQLAQWYDFGRVGRNNVCALAIPRKERTSVPVEWGLAACNA